MASARFSIVIPTRNRDDVLVRCLEHLERQRGSIPVEIIVTDDGVSASTQHMIASTFPGVRWTAGPQRGPAANRNSGAALAVGEFIVFLDDDVEPDPNLIASYSAAIVSIANVYEGRTTCRAGLRSPLEHAPMNDTGGCLWSCNMMVRRTFWESFGGFDEDFPYPHMEDVAFRDLLIRAGEKILFVPGAVVDHPPRRLPAGRVLALSHESHFIYQYKYFGTQPGVSDFLALLFRTRMGRILAHPPSRDTALALASLCSEAWHTLRRWHGWDRKWRDARGSALKIPPAPTPRR
jgi:glycosyltransferase involved in cell wall biosynthesis